MAPGRPREPSIERSEEYEAFIEKLDVYHAKRGTLLEREPKVGQRHLDLLRLYKRVCDEGGYDRVSDTKNNKLAWRRIAAEFLPPSANATTQAFIVKSHYYKNLAAYEITNFHHKKPPPKEILEDVSAKGGDLLTRTKENYLGSASRELENLANGQDKDSDDSDDEDEKTPREDKMDLDEPGGSGGRVTRALRQAPPQRVLFQPEASSSSRQTRSAGQHNSPTPGSSNPYAQSNGSYGVSGNSMSIIANYEPKPVVPSNVKPVTTPSNNPEHFRNMRNRLASRSSRSLQPNKGMMLPGTGFTGPNIYIRALLALQSGSVEEQAYALHHLVKISHERGDKYRFDGFPGLAEALIGRLLEVSTLFYGVHWEVCYSEDETLQRNDTLNAISGTADLLEKINSHSPLDFTDDVQTKEFSEALARINEAGLVIRNLVMLDANAQYVSQLPLIQDFITIALNLPPRSSVVELKHYALEIAEQLSRYWLLNSDHHLYLTLLAQLNSTDRGTIINSLRALSRIAMNANPRYELNDVPVHVIQQICDWLLVEDEHLREACLDFLYLYTATTDNVDILTQNVDVEALVKQLVRLLLYNAQTIRVPGQAKPAGKPTSPAPETAPKLASAIIDQLISLDEPDRSSQWLKTCFEEDQSGEITQIALWTAYNAAFQSPIQKLTAQNQPSSLPSTPGSNAPPTTQAKPPKPLMAAKDFITNVSNTFNTASAQVVTAGAVQKYTIKGIRPRTVPVDLRNRPYIKCQWVSPPAFPAASQLGGEECGEFSKEPKQMWDHIVTAHLGLSKDSTGKWQLDESLANGAKLDNSAASQTSGKYDCRWGGCRHFSRSLQQPTAYDVGMHVQTHLPDSSEKAPLRHQHNQSAASAAVAVSTALHQLYPHQPSHHSYSSFRGRLDSLSGDRSTRMDQSSDIRWLNTAIDERSVAQSLSGASVMVLRNLARRMGRDSQQPKETGGNSAMDIDEDSWAKKAFAPVKDDLFFIMAHNQSLKEGMHDLMRDIISGGG